MEDSDLGCFELHYLSGSNQAFVSQDSELFPHDTIIPEDFLAPGVPDNSYNDNCTTPGSQSSSNNNHLGITSQVEY